jgi:2-dehydro-3-deoxy-D-arabinonate dehydratase
MHYYRLSSSDGKGRLVVRAGEEAFDLTAADPALRTYPDVVDAAEAEGVSIDTLADRYTADAPAVPSERLTEDALAPVKPPEVWAAGVTYHISEQARREESSMPDIYLDVYDAERPELFFKATPSRTVGPTDAVGIRGDSAWNVPEPELGLVLHRGDIVGYTIGNDMSSREIEGENPLYLPQAKVYDRCCSLGPSVASPGTMDDPAEASMSMRIVRDGETVFEEATSTAEMVRDHEELVAYLTRHNPIPEECVLLTGTSLVPPESFTLEERDEIGIEIEGIGTLRNSVTEV